MGCSTFDSTIFTHNLTICSKIIYTIYNFKKVREFYEPPTMQGIICMHVVNGRVYLFQQLCDRHARTIQRVIYQRLGRL